MSLSMCAEQKISELLDFSPAIFAREQAEALHYFHFLNKWEHLHIFLVEFNDYNIYFCVGKVDFDVALIEISLYLLNLWRFFLIWGSYLKWIEDSKNLKLLNFIFPLHYHNWIDLLCLFFCIIFKTSNLTFLSEICEKMAPITYFESIKNDDAGH